MKPGLKLPPSTVSSMRVFFCFPAPSTELFILILSVNVYWVNQRTGAGLTTVPPPTGPEEHF